MGNTASDSLTWMGFSRSPSHKDTNGTVNGFHTGSRVYLITWGDREEQCDHRSIREMCEEMGKPTAHVSTFGRGSDTTGHAPQPA